MAHSLGSKTEEHAKVWRRHNDPPGLWFAIAILSVVLHLLLFWLMRSYSFSLSRQNQTAIPVEIIEISPRRQLKVKPKPKNRTIVLSKPVRQKSQVASLPKQVPEKKLIAKPALRNERKNPLAKPPTGIALAQQRQQNLAQQRQQLAEQQRLSQLAEQERRQQQLAEQQRLSQLAEQERRQQQLAEQQRLSQLAEQERKQQLAEQQRLSELAEQERRQQQLAEQKKLREQELAEQKLRELENQKNSGPLDAPRTGTGDAPRTQNGRTAQTPPKLGGGLSATLSPSTLEELAINTRGNLPTILKDIELPKLAEAPGQEPNSITIPATFKLQPGKFIYSLVIEDNGKCSNALLLDKDMPSADKKIYEQFGVQEICQKQKFVPAYKRSDRKPLASNLYVSITIEQKAP
jgi:hypothetical protein